MLRDARLGAVRQLVAQCVRTGREDRQPAAYGARVGDLRDRERRPDADARQAESQRGYPAQDLFCAVPRGRRPVRDELRDLPDRIQPALPAARRRILPDVGDLLSIRADRRGARVEGQMGGDDHRRRVHGADARPHVGDSAHSCRAEAGADLSTGHPDGGDGLATLVDRARVRNRLPAAAILRPLSDRARGDRSWRDLLGSVPRDPVALVGVHGAESLVAELVLQRRQLRVLGVAELRGSRSSFRAGRIEFLFCRDRRVDPRVAVEPPRTGVGQLDGARPPMKRSFAIAMVLAIGVVTSAHVGSPDSFFDGTAGPYKIHVRVTPPSVVPGLASIFVRSDEPDISGIVARPVCWRAGLQGAPRGDSLRVIVAHGLFSGQLWLMSRGAYSIELDVDGARGKHSAVVPVMAMATGRLGLSTPLIVILVLFGALLFSGLVAIVRAAASDSLGGS